MSWLLAEPPTLTESLPEWLKGVARNHLYKDLQSFTTALGFGPCTTEQLFFDPPVGLIELISQKTSVSIGELIRRTAKYVDHFPSESFREYGEIRKRRSVGIVTAYDLIKKNGRADALFDCDLLYGFRHITSNKSVIPCILNEVVQEFGGWSVIVSSTDQLPMRWNIMIEMADKLLNRNIILQSAHPKVVFSRSYINMLMNEKMRHRVEVHQRQIMRRRAVQAL